MINTPVLDKNDYLRVVGVYMQSGDTIEFDVTGDDLGNGYTDTSCHAGWYVEGRFFTSYGGEELERTSPSIGCPHVTEPNDQYTYPTGKVKVRCAEDGKILFVQQLREPHDKWDFELVEGGAGLLIDTEGKIQDQVSGLALSISVRNG